MNTDSGMVWVGTVGAFLSSCTWALGITAYAPLSMKYPASAVNVSRAIVAFPLFCLFSLLRGEWSSGITASSSSLLWLGASVLTSFAFADVIFLLSTRSLGVPSAMAIASCYPIWSALSGWAFRNEALSTLQLVGLLCVVIGVVVVILSGGKTIHASDDGPLSKRWIGVTLAFGTSFMWAFNTVAVSAAARELSIGTTATIRMAMALVLCPLVGQLLMPGQRRVLPATEFRRYGWIFAVEGFGGALTFVIGLTYAPLAVAAALSSLAPILSVPIAIWKRYEVFNPIKFCGILLAFFGVYLLISRS